MTGGRGGLCEGVQTAPEDVKDQDSGGPRGSHGGAGLADSASLSAETFLHRSASPTTIPGQMAPGTQTLVRSWGEDGLWHGAVISVGGRASGFRCHLV